MKKVIWMALIAGALSSASVSFALEFSADAVSSAGGKSFSGKIYVANDKVRMEMPGAISITRMDKKITWVLLPDQNMYMEQALDTKTIAGTADKVPGELERTFIQDEAIDGRDAKKYQVKYAEGANTMAMFQWIDTATSIPLKTEAIDGSWYMEYKNLQAGPQDPSLFEVPQGYSKFAIPSMKDIAQ